MSLPIYYTQKMTEFLRRLVIKFFLDEKIINERKALESIISLKGTKAP